VCVAVSCSALQCVVVCVVSRVCRCVVLCCSELQCVAVCCGLVCVASLLRGGYD